MKIGIITHFNKSTNYGGVLQAYALTKKLEILGYDAEQISYIACIKNLNSSPKCNSNPIKKSIIKRCFHSAKARLKNFMFYCQNKKRKKIITNKQNCFKNWTDENVKSSKVIYNHENIKDSLNVYDSFITGSDQVWNYNWYDKNYFLDFVDEAKTKISYAASLGHNSIPKNAEEVFENHLKSFDAISVREENMVDLLQPISPTKVEWVVDPVFLLDKKDWENVATNNPCEKQKYIFCYFLGTNKKERQIALSYARKRGLKIIVIGNLLIAYREKLDESFADIKIKSVNPGDFLSLIKNAECVFTDSFHATAFSLIFEKQFFVFNRYKDGGMNDRIKSVLNLFNLGKRFCEGEKENKEYVNSLENFDYLKTQ